MLLLQCVAAVAALSGAIAAPFDLLQNRDFTSIEARQSSVGEEGVWDGMYYWFWTDGAGQVNFNRTGPSNYKVNWKDSGNFLGGVGRKPGTNKYVTMIFLSGETVIAEQT
jgi:endo-1,4-beta-xylanase